MLIRIRKYFLCITIVVSLLLCMGCTNPQGLPLQPEQTTLPTNEPTPLPQTTIQLPTETITPTQLIAPEHTVTQTVQTPIILTPTPVIEPTDISEITFLRYSDPDFLVAYPSTWTVEPGDPVVFTSATKKITFTASVYDFLLGYSGYSGGVKMNPDISWVMNRVSLEYPQYNARNLIYDYSQMYKGDIPVVIYSIRLPDGSRSYTRYVLVTVRHAYEFTFSADNATFSEYAQLRDYMFNSLVIHDTA